jgi:hypothetical protein
VDPRPHGGDDRRKPYDGQDPEREIHFPAAKLTPA